MSRPLPAVGDYPKWSPWKRALLLLVATAWSLTLIFLAVTWGVRWVLTGVAAISSTGWVVLTVIAGVIAIVVSIQGEKRYRRGGSR